MNLTERYQKLLMQWIPSARAWIVEPEDRKDLAYYGTGTDIWGIQTHMKAFSAFAALAGSLPESDSRSVEIREYALKMLRFTLESHKTGSYHCTDGTDVRWGHHWLATLGIERMMHGIEAIEPYLTAHDRHRLRAVFTSEADYLCDHRKVEADPISPNVPESNLWSGAFLHRAAWQYPDAARAAEWKRHGTALLLNSISLPSDRHSSTPYAGIPEREWHVGANFFESGALNHHGYMNVGYMVICLSNIAMLHFSMKCAGVAAPPELYHHFLTIWRFVRSCLFDDGRLWRIGGDTRVRYCYCQDYLIPVLLLAADLEGEDTRTEESGWLSIVETEAAHNGDGSFLSDRCELFRARSPLYYTRLESDRACTLAMGLHWRRCFSNNFSDLRAKPSKSLHWMDAFHGAYIARESTRMASFTWIAAERPSGSVVPPTDSSMHESRFNLVSMVEGGGLINQCEIAAHEGRLVSDGFITGGVFDYITAGLLEENDVSNCNARNHLLFCAIPDGQTVVTLQLCTALRRCWITHVYPLNLTIPNDIFNAWTRDYQLSANSIAIDGRLRVSLAYDALGGLSIERGHNRSIGVTRIQLPDGHLSNSLVYRDHGMLKVDRILAGGASRYRWYNPGEILFDFGAVLTTGGHIPECRCFADGDLRAIRITGADGKHYIVAADFGQSGGKRDILGKTLNFETSPYQISEA